MLGLLIQGKIRKRWAKPNMLIVLFEFLFNLGGILGAFYSYNMLQSAYMHQLIVLLGIFYLINLMSIIVLIQNDDGCCLPLTVEIVLFVIYIIYHIVGFFKDDIEDTKPVRRVYALINGGYLVYMVLVNCMFGNLLYNYRGFRM